MKPFSAWLAMNFNQRPRMINVDTEDGTVPGYAVVTSKRSGNQAGATFPQRALIVADTPENRKLLGMEER